MHQADLRPDGHPTFSAFFYRYWNRVERSFNKIKHFCAIVLRFEIRPENYLAAVKLTAIKTWLRSYEPVS